MEAALGRERRQHRFFAAMTANIMNCFGPKKPVTVEVLLGIGPETRKPEKPDAASQARFRSLCRNTSGAPIWQKLEDASRRADEKRKAKLDAVSPGIAPKVGKISSTKS